MPSYYFRLPPLPMPHYRALKQLDRALGCTDLELVCTLVELCIEQWDTKKWRKRVRAKLAEFRATPPSQEHMPEVGSEETPE